MNALSTTLDLGVIGTRAVTVYYKVSTGFSGTYYEPPEHPVVTLMSVVMDGIDLADMLPEWMLDDIKRQCSEDNEDSAACAADSRADQMRDECLMNEITESQSVLPG